MPETPMTGFHHEISPLERLTVLAMRLWHKDGQSWLTMLEPAARYLAPQASRPLLAALGCLSASIAENAVRDVALRPPGCRRLTPDEATIAAALRLARAGDLAGTRRLLAGILEGEAQRQATIFLGQIADCAGCPAGHARH